MKDQIGALLKQFTKELDQVSKICEIEAIKITYLGKKGPVQELMKELRHVPAEERPETGKMINDLKVEISSKIEAFHKDLYQKELLSKLKEEKIDVTLPGRRRYPGAKHPISQMMDEMVDILISMGFSVQHSPEIESEFYNYGGLNYPPDHPARDMQDTFYLSDELLLRSHTTSIQQRVMEKHEPPIRIISFGKCYRNETVTARSHVLFHQVDGFYVDKGVTFADLLATKEEFYSRLFNQKIELRVRASYFPFVEPGMEVDIRCTSCKGSGCRLCKDTGWLEVCGAGMVHPEVLKEGGVDPEVYSGYAWGGGVERLFMLRHGISDIRLFLAGDMRFLSQF